MLIEVNEYFGALSTCGSEPRYKHSCVCSTTSSTALPVIGCYLARSSEDVYQVSLSLAEVDYVRTLQQKHTQNKPKDLKHPPPKNATST